MASWRGAGIRMTEGWDWRNTNDNKGGAGKALSVWSNDERGPALLCGSGAAYLEEPPAVARRTRWVEEFSTGSV